VWLLLAAGAHAKSALGEDLPEGFDQPEQEIEGGPRNILDPGDSKRGWPVPLRWVRHDDPSQSLDGLWRVDGSYRRGQAIVVAWPTDMGGFRGPGVHPIKRFDDAPKGSEELKKPTAVSLWRLEDTCPLFPGGARFRISGDGVKPVEDEVIVKDEKQEEIFYVKTYPVGLELRSPTGALMSFPADALLYAKERVLQKMRTNCLTATVWLPKSHDPETPYQFRVKGGLVDFHVGSEGLKIARSLGVTAACDGNVLVARYPAMERGVRSQLTRLSQPFSATLSGKGVKVGVRLSSRVWGAQEGLELGAPETWTYEFSLTDPKGDAPTKLEAERKGPDTSAIRRPEVPYTLGSLNIVATRRGPNGQPIVATGSARLFLRERTGAALSLFKRNMGRQVYLAGEEIELYVLGTKATAPGELVLSCASETGRTVGGKLPVKAEELNGRPMAVGFDTALLSAGEHTLRARLGDLVSNKVRIALVEDVHDSDYLTLAYYKYPSVYGTTRQGLLREMANRGVNTLIANYDGRGPGFGRPRSLASPWEQLDPNHELPRHAEEVYLQRDGPTALMDVCTSHKVNYINYGHMVNWCIFGHREDDAEYRRQAIIRAYQLRQFPSFVGMHYTDNDLPCAPGQAFTGGPAYNSDARAGWRMREFNRRFNEKYGKVDADLGAAVPEEVLSKADIDQALNLAASARFSENPKARGSLEKTIQGLDRRRTYFRAYHLIWGDLIGGSFRRDIKAMSPRLLVSNAASHQYPDYYFHSFDCGVNSLMTDFGIIPLHNWSGADLLHMGKMRKRVVFDAVRPCITHFDRLMFQSLARQADGLGYGYTHVETMQWAFHPDWRRRCLYSYSFLKRYGSAVRDSRPLNEIVILNSETMASVSGGMHPTVYYRAHYALTRAGLPVQFATEADVAGGELEGQAGLLLVNQQMPLPSQTVKAIEQFAANGGQIYQDADTVIRLPESAKRIDVRFTNYRGFGFDGGTEFRMMDDQSIPRGETVADVITRDFTPDVQDANPHVLTRLFHGPDIRYLIAIAEATRNGHVTQHGWPGHAEKVKVREKPTHVIDLIDWQRVPVSEDGTFEVDFAPYTARLYAMLPEEIRQIGLAIEDRIALGREARLQVVPRFASGREVRSCVPLDVTVRAPDGEERHRVLRTVSGENPCITFPLGEDDPTGMWRVDVTELVSGTRASATFEVGQRIEHTRLRRFGDVVVHDAKQITDFLRGTKGIEVALDYRQSGLRDLAGEWTGQLRGAGCDVSVRVVRQAECREYPSRWWYDKDELPQVRPVEEGKAIGVRTKGAGIKGTFKIEDDNFRELHLTSITRLKYKRSLILFDADGNWLYGHLGSMLTHQPTRNFPGQGQAVVQMIWAPFDTGYNAVVINARDRDGVQSAMRSLEELVRGQSLTAGTVARPTPRFTHRRFASLMDPGRTEVSRDATFRPLECSPLTRAPDNGMVKPSIYQIYHTAADGEGRFNLAASGIGNVGFDENLKLIWKKHGLDILRGPIAKGRIVARAGPGLVLNPNFSVYMRLGARLPFAVSDDGRVFVQRKNNTFAWSADGDLLWKRSLVGEALRNPRVFRSEAKQIAVDPQGRYVAGSKAWTREEHHSHLSPYLYVRDARSGELLWHAVMVVSGLRFTGDAERLVICVARGLRGDARTTGVRVVDPATGRVLWEKGFGGGSSSPAVHPEGTQAVAVTGSAVKSISPEEELNWRVPVTSVVKSVRFAPDGEHVGYTTIYNEVTILDRRGRRTAEINCFGKPRFSWKSSTEIFFASERGHLGIADINGKLLASDNFTKHVKTESVPLSEPEKLLSPPSLYDTPFLEAAQALRPKTVSVGWETKKGTTAPDKWPTRVLESETKLTVSGKGKAKHERRFLVFRARCVRGGPVDLTVSARVGQSGLFTHRFRFGRATEEYVVGLPSDAAAVECTFEPGGPTELTGPAVVALPFEFPNLARMYPVEQTAANPDLEQYVADITLITETRCINYDNLPMDGDHLKLLNAKLYDTRHWASEKFLTVHDYVVRRKATSTVDFGCPIPVDIRLKRPAMVNCVIAHHVAGAPNSPTADMGIEVYDTDKKAWRLMGYREDNQDLSSVFAFEPVATDRVRYWMLATGNRRYGVSEVEIFGPTDPGMGSLEQSEDIGDDDKGGDKGGLLDGL